MQNVLSKKKELLLVPILFFILTLLYLFPLTQGLILLPLDLLIGNYAPWYNPGTILLKNPYMQDSIAQLYPWRHLVFQSLTQGIIPLWNPYQLMGMPFMAGMKPMVFYPLNIFFLLGEVRAWNALLFSQILLSFSFSYLLAREFKLTVFPSLLVSISFALSSLMIGLLEFGSDGHALIWWPLFLYAAKRFIDSKKGVYLFLLGISITFSIFAGQLQYTTYGLLMVSAFIVFYGWKTKLNLRGFTSLIVCISLGVGISAIQLLPALELFSFSHRGLLDATQAREVFARGLLRPELLLRLYAPDFFGNPTTRDVAIGYIESSGYFGIIPLFFSLYAMVFARKNIFVTFFTIVFAASLIFSLQIIGLSIYYLKIPILTSGSGERLFSLALFSGAILSGFGLAEFIEIKNKRRQFISIGSFVGVFILIIVSTALIKHGTPDISQGFIRNIKFPTIILGMFSVGTVAYLLSKARKDMALITYAFFVFVVCITFFDLFRLGYRFLTFSNEKFLYPEIPVVTFIKEQSAKTLTRNFGLTEPELATYLNVYTAEAYNPLYLTRTALLLQTLQGKSHEKLPLDNKYFLTSDKGNLKRTLDILGVEFIVIGKDENPINRFYHENKYADNLEKVYQDDRHAVFRNESVFPRFGLFYHARRLDNDQKILESIGNNNTDLQNEVILSEDLPFTLQSGTGSASLISSNLNSQTFEVTSNKPALFYISDTYFPGWTATVNNQPTKIYKANYAFRSVPVPSGKSQLKFEYLPGSFTRGIVVSLISIFSLLLLAGLQQRLPLRKLN